MGAKGRSGGGRGGKWECERTFLAHERKGPGENVHEVGQPVRMWRAVELANVHNVVFVLEDGCLVVVDVEVVGR